MILAHVAIILKCVSAVVACLTFHLLGILFFTSLLLALLRRRQPLATKIVVLAHIKVSNLVRITFLIEKQ